MEGSPRQSRTYYRCAARGIVPGSPVLDRHPKNVYLPERAVIEPVNAWIGELFDPEHRDATVDLLLASAGAQEGAAARLEQVRRKVAKAETDMHRLQDAINAGANPAALVDAINQAHAQYEAARAELEGLPAGRTLSRADVYAMIDYLGDVGDALNDADPARLETLYEDLRLEMIYHPEDQAVDVSIRPGGRDSERVRGGT